MPGILPMKVIKVGTSTQARIAQACDRCRSKKIRCDGVSPTCTPCASVGFQCKTSDKLSRRAFPRGYTETLEERVRSLEAEVRELKDLLDEKDEQIDVLSRIRPRSPRSVKPLPSPAQTPDVKVEKEVSSPAVTGDLFRLPVASFQLHTSDVDATYTGPSSTRALASALITEIKVASDSSPADLVMGKLLDFSRRSTQTTGLETRWKAPPRMLSDQLVNIFFQEWAPVLPILHKPEFLWFYEEYTAGPDAFREPLKLAQLHLVFAIAAHSSQTRDERALALSEQQWRLALSLVSGKESLPALQCLTLAVIACLLSGDQRNLHRYRGLAVSLAQRLGLNHTPKRFTFNVLVNETRKKVFWSLYTLDCFAAAQTGLPRLLRDADIECEYPADADDDYVTETGFLPMLPGESTKISAALALFRCARTLGKSLNELYPALPSQNVSLKSISDLSEELDSWHGNLPAHLCLQFVAGKPSTNVVHSRSPILTLTYHYVRTLIHKSAVLASSVASKVAFVSSTKPTVQILQLLDERGLCLALPISRAELLTNAGLGLLFQSVELERGSKLLNCHRQCIVSIIDLLEKDKAANLRPFGKLAAFVLMKDRSTRLHEDGVVGFSSTSIVEQANLQSQTRTPSGRKFSDSTGSENSYSNSNLDLSPVEDSSIMAYSTGSQIYSDSPTLPNLDYLSFENNLSLTETITPARMIQPKPVGLPQHLTPSTSPPNIGTGSSQSAVEWDWLTETPDVRQRSGPDTDAGEDGNGRRDQETLQPLSHPLAAGEQGPKTQVQTPNLESSSRTPTARSDPRIADPGSEFSRMLAELDVLTSLDLTEGVGGIDELAYSSDDLSLQNLDMISNGSDLSGEYTARALLLDPGSYGVYDFADIDGAGRVSGNQDDMWQK